MGIQMEEYVEKNAKESECALISRQATILTNMKREMALYESSGNRGHYLEQVYVALLSIPPTSVEECSR